MKESTQRKIAAVRLLGGVMGYRRRAIDIARLRAEGEFEEAQAEAVELTNEMTGAMERLAALPGMNAGADDRVLVGMVFRARFLADALSDVGDLDGAVRALESADIRMQDQRPPGMADDNDVDRQHSLVLAQLARLHKVLGEESDAIAVLTRALDMRVGLVERLAAEVQSRTAKKVVRRMMLLHDEVLSMQAELALLLATCGDVERAEQLLGDLDAADRVIIWRRRSSFPAQVLLARGWIARHRGDLLAARSAFEEAAGITSASDHVMALAALGDVLVRLDDLEAASRCYSAAVESVLATHGPDHPIHAEVLSGMSIVQRRQGNRRGAIESLARALQTSIGAADQLLTSVAEGRRREYLAWNQDYLSTLVALLAEEGFDAVWANRILELTVDRKGLLLEADRRWRRDVRSDLEARNLMEAIDAKRALIERHGMDWIERPSDGLAGEIAQMHAELIALERRFANRSADRTRTGQAREAALDRIATSVRRDEAFIDVIRTSDALDPLVTSSARKRPDVRTTVAARYLALVVTSEPTHVTLHDLGTARPIDLMAEAYIACMSGARAGDGRSEIVALSSKVLDPLRDRIRGRHGLVVSPDGLLGNVPFESLLIGPGELVRHTFAVRYVTAGRDLFDPAIPSTRDPGRSVVLGDPLRLADVNTPLRDARVEALAVAELLRVDAHLGPDATKRVLLEAVSPAVVHIASHSRIYPSNALSAWGTDQAIALVLADDGEAGSGDLLPAEIATLDLAATSLVCLSACSTGFLHDTRIGDPVAGLRRAFTIAGAASMVVSLWNVPDEPTAHLMTSFYQALGAGASRVDALRFAQREVEATYKHPSTWHGFVLYGDSGRLPPAVMAQ